MSGPIPNAVAQAANELAMQAYYRDAAARNANLARAVVETNRRAMKTGQSLPGRTWEAISTQVRTALVMLTLDTPGDPRTIARQPWESFSDQDRAALAATARQFHDELKHARCLW